MTFYYYTDVKTNLEYTGNHRTNLDKFLMWVEGVNNIEDVDFVNNFYLYGSNNGNAQEIPTQYRCNATGYMLECSHNQDYTHITHCICGCAIQKVNYYIHTKTSKKFYIGSKCVERFNETQGKTKKEIGESLGKKYCFICPDDKIKKLIALRKGDYYHIKCVNKNNKKHVEYRANEIRKEEETKKNNLDRIRFKNYPDKMDTIEWGEDYVGKTYKYVIDNDPLFAYLVYTEYIETNDYFVFEFTPIEQQKILHFRAYYHFNILNNY